MPVIKKRT